MCYRYFTSLIFFLGCFLLSSCGTVPVVAVEDTAHIATAKRFLQNVDAGELAMSGFKKSLEKQSKEQPGLAEFLERAFVDINEEFFVEMVAKVYSHHITHEDLIEIVRFSEKPAIKLLFRVAFQGVISGESLDKKEFMRQLSADELTDIMKFTLSDSFVRMKEALPIINQELAHTSKSLGQEIIRDYLKTQ